MAPAPFGPWVSLLLVSLLATPAVAQQPTTPVATTSDPQAVAVATKALAALTGGKPITDVTLTGTATRTAGSDVETGTVTLQALGYANSRMDFAGSNGNRTEIRNSSSGVPQGSWIDPDASNHAMSPHNCMTDAVWFFPALSILSQISQPNVVATYVGQETRNGSSVQHLRFLTQTAGLTGQKAGLAAQAAQLYVSLSNEDVYLDSSTLLPVSVTFNTHANNNSGTNIPVEIDFSDYVAVSGVPIPFKIQEFLNDTPFRDVVVQSASLNSGLSQSTFDIQ